MDGNPPTAANCALNAAYRLESKVKKQQEEIDQLKKQMEYVLLCLKAVGAIKIHDL